MNNLVKDYRSNTTRKKHNNFQHIYDKYLRTGSISEDNDKRLTQFINRYTKWRPTIMDVYKNPYKDLSRYNGPIKVNSSIGLIAYLSNSAGEYIYEKIGDLENNKSLLNISSYYSTLFKNTNEENYIYIPYTHTITDISSVSTHIVDYSICCASNNTPNNDFLNEDNIVLYSNASMEKAEKLILNRPDNSYESKNDNDNYKIEKRTALLPYGEYLILKNCKSRKDDEYVDNWKIYKGVHDEIVDCETPVKSKITFIKSTQENPLYVTKIGKDLLSTNTYITYYANALYKSSYCVLNVDNKDGYSYNIVKIPYVMKQPNTNDNYELANTNGKIYTFNGLCTYYHLEDKLQRKRRWKNSVPDTVKNIELEYYLTNINKKIKSGRVFKIDCEGCYSRTELKEEITNKPLECMEATSDVLHKIMDNCDKPFIVRDLKPFLKKRDAKKNINTTQDNFLYVISNNTKNKYCSYIISTTENPNIILNYGGIKINYDNVDIIESSAFLKTQLEMKLSDSYDVGSYTIWSKNHVVTQSNHFSIPTSTNIEVVKINSCVYVDSDYNQKQCYMNKDTNLITINNQTINQITPEINFKNDWLKSENLYYTYNYNNDRINSDYSQIDMLSFYNKSNCLNLYNDKKAYCPYPSIRLRIENNSSKTVYDKHISYKQHSDYTGNTLKKITKSIKSFNLYGYNSNGSEEELILSYLNENDEPINITKSLCNKNNYSFVLPTTNVGISAKASRLQIYSYMDNYLNEGTADQTKNNILNNVVFELSEPLKYYLTTMKNNTGSYLFNNQNIVLKYEFGLCDSENNEVNNISKNDISLGNVYFDSNNTIKELPDDNNFSYNCITINHDEYTEKSNGKLIRKYILKEDDYELTINGGELDLQLLNHEVSEWSFKVKRDSKDYFIKNFVYEILCSKNSKAIQGYTIPVNEETQEILLTRDTNGYYTYFKISLCTINDIELCSTIYKPKEDGSTNYICLYKYWKYSATKPDDKDNYVYVPKKIGHTQSGYYYKPSQTEQGDNISFSGLWLLDTRALSNDFVKSDQKMNTNIFAPISYIITQESESDKYKIYIGFVKTNYMFKTTYSDIYNESSGIKFEYKKMVCKCKIENGVYENSYINFNEPQHEIYTNDNKPTGVQINYNDGGKWKSISIDDDKLTNLETTSLIQQINVTTDYSYNLIDYYNIDDTILAYNVKTYHGQNFEYCNLVTKNNKDCFFTNIGDTLYHLSYLTETNYEELSDITCGLTNSYVNIENKLDDTYDRHDILSAYIGSTKEHTSLHHIVGGEGEKCGCFSAGKTIDDIITHYTYFTINSINDTDLESIKQNMTLNLEYNTCGKVLHKVKSNFSISPNRQSSVNYDCESIKIITKPFVKGEVIKKINRTNTDTNLLFPVIYE